MVYISWYFSRSVSIDCSGLVQVVIQPWGYMACSWVAVGYMANRFRLRLERQALTSTEMAHRQNGGYKEEPGVAVGGDHVS
jgi:hypothetical protein